MGILHDGYKSLEEGIPIGMMSFSILVFFSFVIHATLSNTYIEWICTKAE